jgi:hypothetical protein
MIETAVRFALVAIIVAAAESVAAGEPEPDGYRLDN